MKVNHQGYAISKGKLVHQERARAVLTKPMPKGACTLHVNGDRGNPNAQLVICPDRAYHRLLKMRLQALNACGDPNARQCAICKEWDNPQNLQQSLHYRSQSLEHKGCREHAGVSSSRDGSTIYPEGEIVFPSWTADLEDEL